VLFDQGGYSLATFLTGTLVARACPKAEYGTFILGLTLVFFTGTVQHNLVAIPFTVLSQSLARQRRSTYLGSSLLQHIALSSLIFLGFVLALGVAKVFRQDAGQTKLYLPLAAAAVATHFRIFMRSVLLAELRPWLSFAMGVATNTVTISGIIALYAAGHLTTVTACMVMALGSMVPAGAVLFKERKSFGITGSQVPSDFVKNWRYGRWILAATGANVVGIRVLPWLTLLWCGEEIVAIVGVVTMVACIVRPALEAAGGYLTPKLANHAQSSGTSSAIRKAILLLKLAIIFGCIYVFFMLFFGDRLVGILYTSRYQGHAIALTAMAAAISIKAANVPIRALLTAINRPKTIYHSSMCASVITILTGIVMIPRLGVIGVAFVVMVHHMVSLCVNYLCMVNWSKRLMASEKAAVGALAIRC
jgi:O-antigen/teichoic acid export membrane protein